MNEFEIKRLRALLLVKVKDYVKLAYLTDDFIRLNEDSSYSKTTAAEVLVFGIEPELIPQLQIAYMAYEALIDVTSPPDFDEELGGLIIRARSVAPPFKSFGQEFAFETGLSDEGSFQWFAKTFLDLPERQAAAIYAKHQWSSAHLANLASDTIRSS